MTKLPISVFIITKNEEDRIADAINSVKSFADEVLIIDSGSEDDTVSIASELGAKIIFNKWPGYGPQKVFGETHCRNNWVLNIDADERVSDELAYEIIDIFTSSLENQHLGYRIRILNQFFNEEEPKSMAYYYNQFRLYRKEFAGFKDSIVHDSVELKEKSNSKQVLNLKNTISHKSFRSYGHWIDKINHYSEMQALDALTKGKNVSMLKLVSTPFLSFLKGYFIRRYFIYGFNGIIYSYIFAFGRTLKMAKIRATFAKNKK
jgi:glycosyltransferase involved in cell wall biosynthesis